MSPEAEAIREQHQGLQGLQPSPCEPNGRRELTFPTRVANGLQSPHWAS